VIAAKCCLTARRKLGYAEGLDDVVVRAELEKDYFLLLSGIYREHDDRHIRPCADRFQHFDAAHVGQTEVEHNHIRLHVRGSADSSCPSVGLPDLVAVKFEPGTDEPPDLGFVVDYEHRVS
jgi:hypothetical protein